EIRGSSLIRIKVLFPNARLASEIANSLAGFAVEENNDIFNSDVKSTRDYLRNALDNARSDLEKLRAERTAFRRTSNIESLRTENNVLLGQRVDLEGRYFQVAYHLKKLRKSPAAERLLEKKSRLAQIQREVDLDVFKAKKESLLSERKALSRAVDENETDLSVEQVKLKNLQDQMKVQKKIDVIKRSVIDHPEFLMALKEAGRVPPPIIPNVQIRSEEFNPVYRSTEEALLHTVRTVAGIRTKRDLLKQRLARIEKELPKVSSSLVEYQLKYDLASAEYDMARSEWDRQVAPWKARTIQTGPGDLVEKLTIVGEIAEIGTEAITVASKEVLKGELKANEKRLSAIQSELSGKSSRMERLNQNYNLASDLFNLYSKKYGESLLWVASRVNVIKVVDLAHSPVSPVSPNKRFNLIAGLVIGFLFFSFLALFLDYIAKVRSRPGSPGNA
ncbi:MAG: hypothetical protein QGF68_18050, partial [Nitrospinota bacterium]|nr:hypothetical protein [Nitrospinota bacterium]